MACDIANGRLEACKDSISGIDAIYFINYGAYDPEADVTYNATNTNVIDSITGVPSLYKYELKGANGLDETIETSRDNGTTFFSQVLTAQLKKQDFTMHKNVALLAYGRPHIVVKTRTNQFKLVGLERGADLTAGNVSTGVQMGDFNGYNLTFTAMENLPANFLNCTSETALISTVFPLATLVVS